jgi:quercetin dioxygenase-like cupin family protein
MRCKLISLFLACVVIPVAAQKNKAQTKAPSEVEITSEPNHHLVFQNTYVRVFQVEVAPNSATLMHRHRHDYTFVTLGPSQISNEVEGKPPVTLNLHDGETRFAPGNFAHRARNLADTPFRNVTIEFLRDEKESSSKWDEDRGLHVLHGGTQEVLFVNDGVRVSEVELQTAGVLPKHHHPGPRLLVAVTDLVFRDDVVGKPASNIEMKSGDVKWLEAGVTHTITNVGMKQAKFVELEF